MAVGLQPHAIALQPRPVALAAVRRIESFWEREFHRISRRHFEPLAGGVFAVRGHEKAPRCGSVTITPHRIADNALYCPSSDQIIFDADGLGRELIHDDGSFALTVIMAHEFGHAIQQRTHVHLTQLVAENQADCYAGAYAASTDAGRLRNSSTPGEKLTRSLLGLLRLADPPGANPDRGPAHGTGFDRVSAFVDGLDDGVGACSNYRSAPRPTTSQLYRDPSDKARHGNLSVPEDITAIRTDLDDQYRVVADRLGATWIAPRNITFTTGPAKCPGEAPDADAVSWCDDNVVAVSTDKAADLYRTGDMALGAEIGRAWAAGAERQFSQTFATDSETTECLTGVWIGTLYPRAKQRPTRVTVLSPGDLDEVVRAILLDHQRPVPLARLRGLLHGFYGGLQACARGQA